jgi:uncharacterized protein involved in exopolysaccharide biosynthesis
MADNSSHIDLTSVRDILTTVFKHKYKILLVFVIVSLGVAIWARQRPVVYEAKATLLIKFGREFYKTSEVGNDRFSVSPEAAIGTEMRILTSRELLARVVRTIGPETLYPSDPGSKKVRAEQSVEQAAARLAKSLNIQPQGSSGVIDLIFSHPDPRVAVAVLNALCSFVVDRHLQVFGGSSAVFLEKQMEDYEKKLSASQNSLNDFKQKRQIFSLDEQRTLLIQERSRQSSDLTAVQNQIKELEQSIAYVKSPRWVPESYREASAQLLMLEQRERELLTRFTENSSTVQNLRAEMAEAKKMATRSVDDARSVEISRLEGELNAVRIRAEGIRQSLGRTEGQLRTVDSSEKDYEKLRIDVTTNEGNYQNYLRKLDEARISDDMDRHKMTNLGVLEAPKADMVPRMKGGSLRDVQLMGLGGGLACGLALAFALEFLSATMTTPLSAQKRLGLPVMIAIAMKQ